MWVENAKNMLHTPTRCASIRLIVLCSIAMIIKYVQVDLIWIGGVKGQGGGQSCCGTICLLLIILLPAWRSSVVCMESRQSLTD